MTDNIRPVNDDYSSAGQRALAQIAQAAAQGFNSVLDLRVAKQRTAPYSTKSAHHKCYTGHNNPNATHNLLGAMVESGLAIHP